MFTSLAIPQSGTTMVGNIYCGDCLQLMQTIPDQFVDAIIVDPPYSTTQNKWDILLPLEPLW